MNTVYLYTLEYKIFFEEMESMGMKATIKL